MGLGVGIGFFAGPPTEAGYPSSMRRVGVFLLVSFFSLAGSHATAEPSADEYFEIGVDYLKKGFYRQARRAFAESLLRAPNQSVPLAFAGIASIAGGWPGDEDVAIVRRAYKLLPKGKALRVDLRRVLPTNQTLDGLLRDWEKPAAKLGPRQRDALEILAFLQTHDSAAKSAPALERLLKMDPKDPYVAALAKEYKKKASIKPGA